MNLAIFPQTNVQPAFIVRPYAGRRIARGLGKSFVLNGIFAIIFIAISSVAFGGDTSAPGLQAETRSEQITKENFTFRSFTIPVERFPQPPKSPDREARIKHSKEIETLLKPRKEDAERLLRSWFIGKDIAEFIQFFEALSVEQTKADPIVAKFIWDNFGALGRIEGTDFQTNEIRIWVRSIVANQKRGRDYQQYTSNSYRFNFKHFQAIETLRIMQEYSGGAINHFIAMSQFHWFLDIVLANGKIEGLVVNVIRPG